MGASGVSGGAAHGCRPPRDRRAREVKRVASVRDLADVRAGAPLRLATNVRRLDGEHKCKHVTSHWRTAPARRGRERRPGIRRSRAYGLRTARRASEGGVAAPSSPSRAAGRGGRGGYARASRARASARGRAGVACRRRARAGEHVGRLGHTPPWRRWIVDDRQQPRGSTRARASSAGLLPSRDRLKRQCDTRRCDVSERGHGGSRAPRGAGARAGCSSRRRRWFGPRAARPTRARAAADRPAATSSGGGGRGSDNCCSTASTPPAPGCSTRRRGPPPPASMLLGGAAWLARRLLGGAAPRAARARRARAPRRRARQRPAPPCAPSAPLRTSAAHRADERRLAPPPSARHARGAAGGAPARSAGVGARRAQRARLARRCGVGGVCVGVRATSTALRAAGVAPKLGCGGGGRRPCAREARRAADPRGRQSADAN